MKRLFTAIASALGLSPASEAQSPITTMDPKTILFSLATINDELPATGPEALKNGDLTILEDDWRQFEFVSRSLEPQMKAELGDIKRIFDEKSQVIKDLRLFTNLHVRQRITAPLPTPILWKDLLAAAGVDESAVSGVGFQDRPGKIPNGFSFRVGKLTLYGLRAGEGVQVLCLDSTNHPSLNAAESTRLAPFFEKSGVVLVHWPSMTVFLDKEGMLQYFQSKGGGKS